MILNKFLNGLPVLGLLAMLTACPVTGTDEVQKDESGKPIDLSAKVTALESKVSGMMSKAEILKEIASIGDIDPKKSDQVFGKLAQIMKSAQFPGCHAFYALNVQYPTMAVATKGSQTLVKNGKKGGTLTMTSSGAGIETAGWALAATSKFKYDYADYSVDGKYKLTGSFELASAGTWAVAAAGSAPYHVGAAGNTLKTTEVGTLTLKGEGLGDGIVFTIPIDFGVDHVAPVASKMLCPKTLTTSKITAKMGEKDLGAMPDNLFKYLMDGI